MQIMDRVMVRNEDEKNVLVLLRIVFCLIVSKTLNHKFVMPTKVLFFFFECNDMQKTMR